MDIFSLNIYSETLFERKKKHLKLIAMKVYLNSWIISMAETHAVSLYALELVLVLCAFSAFCKVCHSANTKNYVTNKFEIKFPKQSFDVRRASWFRRKVSYVFWQRRNMRFRLAAKREPKWNVFEPQIPVKCSRLNHRYLCRVSDQEYQTTIVARAVKYCPSPARFQRWKGKLRFVVH